jgi:signal transduction histidine kinase
MTETTEGRASTPRSESNRRGDLAKSEKLDALMQLDRQASLGRLVSEIVHEIRNPLSSIKTFLRLLPERLDDPEFHQDFRLIVSDEVQRLERLIDELLQQANPRPTPHSREGAAVDDVIHTTLQLMAHRFVEQGVVFDHQISSSLPALRLSEDRLRQLLLNLLLNASEITPRRGRVSVSADWSPNRANHLELKISDDGPGIETSLVDRIFEPFWTTRNQAGGLGLAICKRIVDDADGEIRVHNRTEGGACFCIELPIAQPSDELRREETS